MLRLVPGDTGKARGRAYWIDGEYRADAPMTELGIVNPLGYSISVEKDQSFDPRSGDLVVSATDYGQGQCNINFTLMSLNGFNKALAAGGTRTAIVQEAKPAQVFNIKAPVAGANYSVPGKGAITAKTLKVATVASDGTVSAGTTALVLDEDFRYDPVGRILQIESFPVGTAALVFTYDEAAVLASDRKDHIQIGDLLQRRGALVIVQTNKLGPKSKLVFPKLTLPPAADRTLSGDDWTSFAFSDIGAEWSDEFNCFGFEDEI